MAGTARTRAQLTTDPGAPFRTGNVPTNADFQNLAASHFNLLDDDASRITVDPVSQDFLTAELGVLPLEAGGVRALLSGVVNKIVSLLPFLMRTVDTIAELRELPGDTRRAVYVRGYWAPGDEGGGTFRFDPSRIAEDDGGLCVAGWVRTRNGQPVTPYLFGAFGTGIGSDAAGIQAAVSASRYVVLPAPAVAWTLNSSDQIVLPAGTQLVGLGRPLVHVSAREGLSGAANAAFVLGDQCVVDGLRVLYPQQAVTDTTAAVKVYPPLFGLNSTSGARVSNIYGERVYRFAQQDSGYFSKAMLENIICFVLMRGLSIVGHMGDVSTARRVHFIGLAGPTYSFGGEIDLTVSRPAMRGFEFLPSGGNRIDGFFCSDSGVIAGAVGFFGQNETWVHLTNCYSDIATQAAVGRFSRLIWEGGWISCGDSYYKRSHRPVFDFDSGDYTIDSLIVSSAQTGGVCGVRLTAGTMRLSGCAFQTTRAAWCPAVYAFSADVTIHHCVVSGSAIGTRPLTWFDVSPGFGSMTIDGARGFGKHSVDFSSTNFNMSTWTGGLPDGWVTSLAGSYSDKFRPLSGVAGIEIYPNAAGAFTLDHALSASNSSSCGFFVVSAQVWLESDNTTLNGVDGAVSIEIGSGSTWNKSCAVLGYTGSPAECSGLPANTWQYVYWYLSAPPVSGALSIRLSVEYSTGDARRLKIQIKSLQIWRSEIIYDRSRSSARGNEFVQSNSVRDTYVNGRLVSWRDAAPISMILPAPGDRVVRNPPVVGAPVAWTCTAGGDPGTWVSEGNL